MATSTLTGEEMAAAAERLGPCSVERNVHDAEVLIRRDARWGDVVLSPVKAVSWAAFAALREQLAEELAAEGLEDYLKNRQQPMDGPRDPYADWIEPHRTGEGAA